MASATHSRAVCHCRKIRLQPTVITTPSSAVRCMAKAIAINSIGNGDGSCLFAALPSEHCARLEQCELGDVRPDETARSWHSTLQDKLQAQRYHSPPTYSQLLAATIAAALSAALPDTEVDVDRPTRHTHPFQCHQSDASGARFC